MNRNSKAKERLEGKKVELRAENNDATAEQSADQEVIRPHPIDRFYNVIVAEGAADALRHLGDELRENFPAATEEPVDEARRHRDWLRREVGAFCTSDPSHTITAWSLESEPILVPEEIPESLHRVRSIRASATSRGLIVGHVGIDTQRYPGAVAFAICSGTKKGFIGSLGNNRGNYFRVMQHCFYGDSSAAFFRAVLDGTAIGPVPYIHRVQWSESESPLRLDFRTEDRRRNGQALSPDPETGDGSMIVAEGYLPPEGTSFNFRLSWVNANILIRRAPAYDVDLYFDDDAQLMVSGYGLFDAGVIDRSLRPTKPASVADEEYEAGLTEEKARAHVMRLYVQLLTDLVDDHRADPKERAMAFDHLGQATDWLTENGLSVEAPPDSAGIN